MGPIGPWLMSSVSFDDVSNGVLAQPEFTPDQAVASALSHEGKNLGCRAVGFRTLTWLPTEALATGLRRWPHAGAAPRAPFG